MLIRKDGDARTCFLVLYLNLIVDDIIVFWCVLFLNTNFLDLFNIHNSRTIKNRELWTVNLNKTVVNAKCIESSKTMFYGRNTYIALCKHRTALGVNHILCDSVDYRHTININTLNLITCILWSWIECYSQAETCVKSLAT